MSGQRKIDKIPEGPRPKKLQILCVGMSRTGTMSLWRALQKLGYKSYHMYECLATRENGGLDYWEEAVQAKFYGKGQPYETRDFDRFLGEYEALTDIPSIFFVDEFIKGYPDAQIIITSRDVEPWVKSMESVFYAVISWKSTAIFRRIDKEFWARYIPWLERTLDLWTDGDRYNRDALRRGFHRHYEHVRRVAPKDRTLEFNLKDGWDPLCAFLGKDVPEEPFPHVNEAPATVNLHTYFMGLTTVKYAKRWTLRILPIAVAAVGWWYIKGQ